MRCVVPMTRKPRLEIRTVQAIPIHPRLLKREADERAKLEEIAPGLHDRITREIDQAMLEGRKP
jgi:hypothetical protein